MTESSDAGAPPLVATKLHIPEWRAGFLSRPRLVDRMRAGVERRLTLVSAPAGFGKSTILAEWAAGYASEERPVAWVSLDADDNDPTFFWTYFLTALLQIQPGAGEATMSLLHAPQPPPLNSFLASLVDEINRVARPFVVVLDDYHLVETGSVHEAIASLLERLPPQMRLVIAGRADPPLPLARLRGRGELTELRVADLRFTADEAASFYADVMGLVLSEADVVALEGRTEGWIAGLQLAALSMQGRDDVAGFIAAFSGDDRYIVDYLAEEVLRGQSEKVRRFLLQTSTLSRLSGPLCDAVTGESGGRRSLEELERRNLFVIPLDDKRQWYRYHHLFADVLRSHALEDLPDVAALHRRASDWYDENHLPSDAIHHALAAEDFERAADLVELSWQSMRRTRREATVRSWVNALPAPIIRQRPILSLVHAMVLLDCGELDAVEAKLQDAERGLSTAAEESARAETSADRRIVADETQLRSLPAMIANARAYRSQVLGDAEGTIGHAQAALDLLQDDDDHERGATAALLGLAYWNRGDLDAAYDSFDDGIESLQKSGGIVTRIGGMGLLARMRIAQGRLREASDTIERALRMVEEHGEPLLRGTAELYVVLSELHLEHGDLAAADRHLEQGEALRERASLPGFEYHWRIVRASLREAHGDLDGALEELDEAEPFYYRNPNPGPKPISALKARIWIKQGRVDDALARARELGLSVDDAPDYLREYEHLTLVRALLAAHADHPIHPALEDAEGILERLHRAASKANRIGTVVETLVLLALVRHARGDRSGAIASLETALAQAEPEKLSRIIVDQPGAIGDLLRAAAAAGIGGAYTRRLLMAVDDVPAASSPPDASGTIAGYDELTPRELEILRLVAAGLRNRDIADQLFISLPTVKRHVANVFGKLGVSRRTEAVARATELKLL